jgi:hypothetical protein
MSWTDDIRCLFCDGKLPLYRKITDGQFCSAAHRKAYWLEHERLAVERLHQTHDSLRAYRPPGAIEAILGHQPPADPSAEAEDPFTSRFAGLEPEIRTEYEPEVHSWLQPELQAASEYEVQSWLQPEIQGVSQPEIQPKGAEIQGQEPEIQSEDEPQIQIETLPEMEAWSPVQAEPETDSPIPPSADFVYIRLELLPDLGPSVVVVDPVEYDMDPAPVCPVQEFAWREHGPFPAGPSEVFAANQLCPAEPGDSFLGNAFLREALLQHVAPLEASPAQPLPLRQSFTFAVPPQGDELQRLLEECEAQAAEAAVAAEDAQVPELQQRYAMPRPSARDRASARNGEAAPVTARAALLSLEFPSSTVPVLDAAPAPGALLRTLPSQGDRAAQWQGTPAGNARALDHLDNVPRGSEALQIDLTVPALRPRLRVARGTRYPVQTRSSAAPVPPPAPAVFPPGTPDIALPQRKATVAAAATSSRKAAKAAMPSNSLSKAAGPTPEAAGPVPEAAGLVPLKFAPSSAKPEANLSTAPLSYGLIPQPPRTELVRPASKLEPLDEKPISDAMPPPPVQVDTQADAIHKAHIWTHAADFLRHAPRDLKTLVFAIPILLGLALHPSLPKVRVTAPPAASGIPRNVQHALSEQLVSVRQTMADRAGVALEEDFRSGLDAWASRDEATAEWSFDATGFVRPGPLALYRPSLGLTDYQFQFLGMIDQKALSWVVRAADFQNFYVIKLTVLKPGPLPTIGITRYAVVNGHADSRVDTLAPIDARPDMLYRVRMDVQGSQYVLTIQGQIADVWSETRLEHGGVGFFSARGEESRIRWVQVTHQYDMLGRLCAYLAPYNILSTNGSWQR